jgi:lipopolysaccharide transport system permease protein
LWSLIRPLLTMVVFTLIFNRLAKLPSGGAPYPILVLAGLLPWQLFANAIVEGSGSLVANTNLITKVFFPRLIIPASVVISAVVDFMIAFGILLIMMAAYAYWPTWRICLIPLFLALAIVTALGASLWFASLTVKYRDFRYVVPFLVQLGVYASPVGFTSDVVPGKWRPLYALNPMVGVIDGFRWSILGKDAHLDWRAFGISCVLSAGIAVGGLLYFRKTEKAFADLI